MENASVKELKQATSTIFWADNSNLRLSQELSKWLYFDLEEKDLQLIRAVQA